MTEKLKVSVDAAALHEVLNGLINNPVAIRELQAIRQFCKNTGKENAINTLIDDYNAEVDRLTAEGKNDDSANS